MAAFLFDINDPKHREVMEEFFGSILEKRIQSLKVSATPAADQVVTAKEAAKRFKVSPETISDWFKSGKLPGGFRLAGRLYFFESALIQGLKEITVKRKRK